MSHASAVLSGLALLLSGCATPVPDTQTGAAQAASTDPGYLRGEQIIRRYCATCHSVTPDGRSPHGPAPSLARISENYPVTALEESLAEGMIVGHPDMPEFRLGPNDIQAVITYLQAIQVRRAG